MSRFKKIFRWYTRLQVSKTPQLNLVWGFFLYTFIGFILLSLPFFHKTDIAFVDSLFMATSAISTTGLITISLVDSFTFFGQFIIMLLIQIGGIGYMTLTTYFLLLTTERITHWHQKIIDTEFSMPNTLKIKDFLKSVIVFTIIMETIGAICFFIAFRGTGMDTLASIWYAIFHSISAFCTAGFALFNNGFEGFQDDGFVNVIISVLSIAGSMGFIVITDLWSRITGRTDKISYTTKIIFYGFVVLLSTATMIIYFTEPLVSNTGDHPIMKSFFQAMSAMTTVGFNTIPTGLLTTPVLLVLVLLMYIGASPSGTAGGMKITTLTAMISILKSRILGQSKITFFSRTIPFERLYVATSTFILYTSLIFIFSVLLSFSEKDSYENILFEVASALGTVGLSTGLTTKLTVVGKLLIIVLMFIGRVGVLTFGFALLARKQKGIKTTIEEDLAV